jgi:hypothetical protein
MELDVILLTSTLISCFQMHLQYRLSRPRTRMFRNLDLNPRS